MRGNRVGKGVPGITENSLNSSTRNSAGLDIYEEDQVDNLFHPAAPSVG
jgi:hypothetical protein